MVLRHLGYRRLFSAIGYSSKEEFPFFSMHLGDLEAWIYLGPEPKLDAVLFAEQRYLVSLGCAEVRTGTTIRGRVHMSYDGDSYAAAKATVNSSQARTRRGLCGTLALPPPTPRS